jgi:putative ABC transport system substrate-binding protein
LISGDNFFNSQSERLATLSVRYSTPAMFQTREFAAAGGLISYGASAAELYHRAGVYTGRVLKGEKPAELPVGRPRKSNCSSTSRPPRHSASPFHSRCKWPRTK